MKKRRVVVTGAGVISALGHDWDTVKARLRSGKNAVRYMHEWDQYPDLKTRLAAPVDLFELAGSYGPKKLRSMGRVAKLAVAATERAITDSGLENDPILKSGRTGISYGSSTGSSDAAMEFFGLLEHKTMERLTSTTYLRMMSHTAAINISICFGITGRMITTNTACTAGSQGIGYAYEAIQDGRQDVMIAGGAEELCPTQAAVFDTVFAASRMNDHPERSPRPFDKDRDGLVLGEGACTLILEEREHARARGANILGEIIGFATNSDGHHLVRPHQPGMERVMRMALEDAGISAGDVGYINAHGTATTHGDIAESHATAAVMGDGIPLSTLKGYTGHTLGTCGAFEVWASVRMMEEGWIAQTAGLDDIDERCATLDYVMGKHREMPLEFTMINNFAFGGVNTSLLVRL